MLNRPSVLVASAIMCCFASSASAASSNWQDLGGGKARLLAEMNPQTNRLNAAVEVQLEPGWSTYWRYPGSSGIPPKFDFSKSRNVLIESILYPTPSLIGSDDNPYAGYKNSVTFPMSGRIEMSADAKLDLQLLIGICATVCIPAQASFTINASELLLSDPEASQKIKLANSVVPQKAEASTVLVDKAVSDAHSLEITVGLGTEDTAHALFVEGPRDWFLTPAKLLKSGVGSATFSLDISQVPKEADVLSTGLVYTLATKQGGVEFRD